MPGRPAATPGAYPVVGERSTGRGASGPGAAEHSKDRPAECGGLRGIWSSRATGRPSLHSPRCVGSPKKSPRRPQRRRRPRRSTATCAASRYRRSIGTCWPCSILFDSEAASEGRYRLVPDRRLFLEDFEIGDVQWESLRIPVDMAFFFYSTPAERVVAFYPSPMGPTESLLKLGAWEELERHNRVLEGMERDVEALLVNRVRGARKHFLVPIDECYSLVGLIRMHWRGLSGGRGVWNEIDKFFEDLRRRSKTIRRES